MVELGAAPGSWTQIVRERLSDKDGRVQGRIIAMDILPMDPIPGVDFIQGDFREEDVLKSLENNDYFIHTKTSNEAREEVNRLCDDLSDFFNDFYGLENDEYNESRIIVSSQELSPSCNYGLIYRSDKFNTFFLKEHLDEQLIIKEIESYRI